MNILVSSFNTLRDTIIFGLALLVATGGWFGHEITWLLAGG